MRAFIALTLPTVLRDRLAGVQNRLRGTDAKVTWVKPRAMHLTLRFLGDIDEDQAAMLAAVVRAEGARATEALELEIGGLGAFPNRNRPRVIWAGVAEHDGLRAMAQRIETAARDAGVDPEDKPFRAHLTLGRVKALPPGDALPVRLRTLDLPAERVEMTELALIRSRLTPAGPRYDTLASARLDPDA